MMDILLVKDVKRLGRRGTLVRVNPGYARNFLLPLGYAVRPTAENLRQVEKKKLQWLQEDAEHLKELRQLAAHLAKQEIRIVEKASEAGHLYGSVSEKSIVAALAEIGITLEPGHIQLQQHIKEVGDFEISVKLHEEVEVILPLQVRAEGREEWLPVDEVEARPLSKGEESPAETALPRAESKSSPAAGDS